MRKNALAWALLLFICGVTFILMGLNIETLTYGSTIFAMGCGFIGSSTVVLYQFWLKTRNTQAYEQHLKKREIDLKDERKIMLRQKSAQITYTIMFVVLITLNIIFTLIGVDKWIILTLWGVITFKYICGVTVFWHLSRKM